MTAATRRLARQIYEFACTYDNFLRESFKAWPTGHTRGMQSALWSRAHHLAAALCDDQTPQPEEIPPRPQS